MSTITQVPKAKRRMSPLAMAFLVNCLWINASEVFRYFTFVMPMMREAFPALPDVAPMNVSIFLIWGVWDTIIVVTATLLPWTAMKVYGSSLLHAVVYGSAVWLAVFVILWLGLYNMNLATPQMLMVALPLAWLELIVASVIVWWFASRNAVEEI
ncbi:hypothetical protein [Phaeobacter sp. C3_T13_0]|uniref:hypothetical protein n=1 Tax=Phaeobacter cretensis TaxID=3342641 RepID=UPI0039BCA061